MSDELQDVPAEPSEEVAPVEMEQEEGKPLQVSDTNEEASGDEPAV